jgi:hypothetical protein
MYLSVLHRYFRGIWARDILSTFGQGHLAQKNHRSLVAFCPVEGIYSGVETLLYITWGYDGQSYISMGGMQGR